MADKPTHVMEGSSADVLSSTIKSKTRGAAKKNFPQPIKNQVHMRTRSNVKRVIEQTEEVSKSGQVVKETTDVNSAKRKRMSEETIDQNIPHDQETSDEMVEQTIQRVQEAPVDAEKDADASDSLIITAQEIVEAEHPYNSTNVRGEAMASIKISPEAAATPYSESILDTASAIDEPQIPSDDIDEFLETETVILAENAQEEQNFDGIEEAVDKHIDMNVEEDNDIEVLETKEMVKTTAIITEKGVTNEDELIELNDDDDEIADVGMKWNELRQNFSEESPPTDTWMCTTVPPNMDMDGTYKKISTYREKYYANFKKFNNEIWKHLQVNYQNDQTFSWKMRMRKMLHDFILKVFNNAQLIAVGSTVNGCGSYNSDMDLCMCYPDIIQGYNTDRNYARKTLGILKKKIFQSRAETKFIKSVLLISAKVPILKITFNSPYDELEVDLNCNNVAGIYNSHLLHYYSRIDDRFPALCLLVKHWAIKHDINDAQTGTFNSYSLILMVLHFLQCVADPPILPNLQKLYPEIFTGQSRIENLGLFMDLPTPLPGMLCYTLIILDHPKNERTVGELLIAFFDYYARFDFDHQAISISRGCVFSRSLLSESAQRYKLYIEEPFDGLNTARCVTRDESFVKIKRAFSMARNVFLGSQAKSPTLERIKVIV